MKAVFSAYSSRARQCRREERHIGERYRLGEFHELIVEVLARLVARQVVPFGGELPPQQPVARAIR